MAAKPVKKDPMRGLWLRGKTWWLDTTLPVRGRIRISLEVEDVAEAIKKARAIRDYPARYFDKLEHDLVELFLAHQERRGISRARIDLCRVVLTEITKAAGGKIQNLSPAMAERWWNTLLARVKPKSARLYFTTATVFFKWAVTAGHVKSSPLALIIPPKLRPSPRKVFLRPEEAVRVIDQCQTEDLKFALYCALHCGLRKGEVIAARPHWFDLEAGLVHVQNEADWLTKDRDNRAIPMTTEFRTFLQTYGIRAPYMFRPDVAPKSTTLTGRYRCDFKAQFNGHMARLGLEHVTFHDLRRTFASLLASAGVSIYKIGKWLGDDASVVESTYGHLIAQDEDINRAWTRAGQV